MLAYLHTHENISIRTEINRALYYLPLADLQISEAIREHKLMSGAYHCAYPRRSVALVELRIRVVDG